MAKNHGKREINGQVFSNTGHEKKISGNIKKPAAAGSGSSWGHVADWYEETIEREGSYQRDLILPNLSRMVAVKTGEKILDVACGEGFFSRALASAGAEVTGTDISPELIEKAKKLSAGKSVRFIVAPAEDQKMFRANSFDKAICTLALQDMPRLGEVVAEVSRVLKQGGKFFFVINHPAFRVPKRSSWGIDEKKNIQFRIIDEYMSESRSDMEVHPGLSGKAVTQFFHRPLQVFFKALEKNGLAVLRLEEWVSDRNSQMGRTGERENKARREFPLFMAVASTKL